MSKFPTKHLRYKRGFIYLIEIPPTVRGERRFKIGAASNYERRFKQLTREYCAIEPLHVIPTDDMAALEASLHNQYSSKWVHKEIFALDTDDIQQIKGLA